MVSLLLIISFLLHLISIYAIYQLFQQLKMKQEDSEEIAEVFETYLQAIKEENKHLQNNLLNDQTDGNMPDQSEEKIIETKEQTVESRDLKKDINNFSMPDIDVLDHVEASLESQVLQLHSQGLSPSEIAQKLNCGNTEAELIIKLYKKSNTNA